MTGREGGYVVPADPANAVGGLKKKGAGSRSWILIDSSGQEVILDVDKYAIMHRVQIHARDLRILDPSCLTRPPSLAHIKAIITSEEVLLRDPLDDNVVPIVEDLRRRLKPVNANRDDNGDGKELVHHDVETSEEDDSPFEFRALEVALEAICSFLSARTIELETAVYPALDMLTSKVRDELEQLLDDDDDMADLYLSRKLAGASPVSGSGAASWFLASPTIGSKISRASRASVATVRGDENDVEELEMLLEAYFMQIDGTFNKLTTLREYIDNTEDYINIQLDNHRNQLIQLELFLSSGTVCLSIYSLVAGIFGMNIPYTWNQDHGYMFKWVTIFTGTFCAMLFILIISYARYKGLVGS
ncbi:UNVERIFIED_CONTAM: Magnesium transporter MRS2-I [Sesamum calycinum]|uniref:Magnesium transporter n=1 Tax=Sesamum calycinum TaxID=2727403 RepID=A0AAW2QKQ7_9LAMI